MIKILTRKKQIAIIKRIVANQYIFETLCPNKELEAMDKYFENEAEAISDIGGLNGLIIATKLTEDLRRKTE